MKILFVIYSMSSGGAERVTADLANYWASREHKVTVVTISGQKHDFYQLNSRVRRISFDLGYESHGVFSALWNNFKRIHALRTTMTRDRPDVAVGMMTTMNCLLALAAIRTGIPTIGSERVYPPKRPLSRLWGCVRRTTYPLLSSVVAQTAQGAEWLRTHTGAIRISVIPNSVAYPLNARSQNKISASSYKNGGKILLAIGRLEEQKGFDRLLSAFATLAADFPHWKLVILGEGSCRIPLIRKIAELNLVSRVVMPGVVENVGEWYEAADLYVMSSRFEGFPNTLLEALAYGLPAVSVDCETGPRDILRHEVDGLLIAQDDYRALISALRRMMSDDHLRFRYATRAIEVRERFLLKHIAMEWESLFSEVQTHF